MSHSKHTDLHHQKKELTHKKNRHNQEIFTAVKQQQDEAARIQHEAQAQQAPSSAPSGEEQVWSEKVGSIRNRLTGQKRSSKERWNRFAGTSGGGGRGL